MCITKYIGKYTTIDNNTNIGTSTEIDNVTNTCTTT